MDDLTIEQWLEKYPYLKRMSEYTLFTTEEEVKSIKGGETVKIDNVGVSIEFLRRILTDDRYYKYAYKFFTNEIDSFRVSYIVNGDTGTSVWYSKQQIIRGMEGIDLSPSEQQRYEELKRNISFEMFLEQNKGVSYRVNLDNNSYLIPIEQIISLMQLSEEEFDKICNDSSIKDINGVPKEYFVYAAFSFFKEKKVFQEFIMPKVICDRFADINSLQKIDIQAINYLLDTLDTKFKEVKLNDELERMVIKDIPEDLSELEKAIYIYIKMCKLLTYDDEYYAVNQKGVAAEKHADIRYVTNISPDNNKVVCFEFNLIYSKFLNDLGIKFSSYYSEMLYEAYGEGHANLEFRSGKFMVSADSVTSILQGDLTRAKLNQPLVGLECINENIKTREEFKDIVSKVYQLVVEQEKEKENNLQVEHIQTFEELINEYSKITTNVKTVGLDEKLSILIEKANETKMIGMDSLSYILQLRKTLFNEQERENNIGVTIIRNNEPFDENKIAMASAIFTLNRKSFIKNELENTYYYYNPNCKLVPISKKDVQAKFDSCVFQYVDNSDPRIPGIIEGGGVKKC